MRGLILDRNKFIVEKVKYRSNLKRAVITLACFFAIGIIVLLNTISLRGLPNLDGGSTQSVVVAETGQFDVSSSREKTIDDQKVGAPSVISNNNLRMYLVTKVVDGDTIYVSGIKTRIRLIGVDTPETVDPRKSVQCFGPDASNYLSSLVLGKYVGLESDSNAGDVDVYGRLLRYVYLDGESVNQKIIINGYGREVSYGSSYKYQSIFLSSQEYAKDNGLGLWSVNTCNGAL